MRQWATVVVAALMLGLPVHAGQGKTIQATLSPAPARTPAPDFALKDAGGKTIRLSDYRGHVVLLDFWATTCGGCIEEIPAFIEIANAYHGRGLRTVGVSEDIVYENLAGPDEAWSRVKPFVRDHNVPYPVLMDHNQAVRSYNITALPLTYLIDSRGRVAAIYTGVIDRTNLETNIRTLLQERGK